jgi:hypothetical protein
MTTTKKPKRFLTFKQLQERWGNCSFMFLERKLREDPQFPKPIKVGRRRLIDEELIEAYERSAVYSYR